MDAITMGPDRYGSPELFRLLADNIPQLAWVADQTGFVFWYNQRWYDYTGKNLQEMEGWGWQSVHHPDRVKEVTARFQTALETGEHFESVFPLRRHDGVFRDFLTRAEPIRDAGGRITHWFGTNTEVTDQLAMEKRATYLLRLDDLLRQADSALAAQQAACELLRNELAASRVLYSQADLPSLRFEVTAEYLGPGVDSVGGVHQVPQSVFERLADGQPFVTSDWTAEAALSDAAQDAAKADLPVRALIDLPHLRGGQLVGWLSVHQQGSRVWTTQEVELAAITAERTWSTIERARAEDERDRAEQALKEANRRFEAVLDNTQMAVFLMDEQQRCVYANAAAERLTGFPIVEILGQRLHEAVPYRGFDGLPCSPENCPVTRAFVTARRAEGEVCFEAADGSLHPIAFAASPIRDDQGKVVGLVVEARDISGEREQEAALRESEARFRTTAEVLPGLLFVTNAVGENIYVNRYYKDYTGLGDGLLGSAWTSVIHPEDLPHLMSATTAGLERSEAFTVEYRMRRADGAYRWQSMRATPTRDEQGELLLWVGIALDIHDRREAEEQARSAAEELEAIYATAPIGLTVLDRELRYVRINERLAEMNGIPAADHCGKTVREVLPALADQAESALRRVLDGEEVWGLEMSGETPAQPGVARTWRENWLPVRGLDGEITGVAISAEEVTREKEEEKRRREAEERFRTIFNSAAVGIGRIDPDGPFLEVNDRYCEILGRTREEILSGGWADITHPDDLEAGLALFRSALVGEIDDYTLEKRYVAKDGSEIWVNLTVSAERDLEGKVKFFVAVVEDIGERKTAEAARRRSEERYRALFESMEQGFCVIQVKLEGERATDWRFVEINPAFTRQSGLGEDVLHRSISEAVPGLEASWYDRYAEIARSGVSQRFIEYAAPLGRWFEVYAFLIGELEQRNVAVLFTDATERIRQEEALRHSEQELRLRLNAIPQMVWSTRPDGHHDFFNDRWYEFTGTPLGSTDGDGWNGMFHPEDQAQAFGRWNRSLQTGEPYEIEYRLRHHDGTHRWVLGRALPIRSEEGEIVRWMGTCTDIHDRVAAAQALQDSEARLRAVIEAAPIGLVFADPSGQITGGNTRVEQLLGHPILPSPNVQSYREWVAYHPDGRRVEGEEFPLAKVIKGESDAAELDAEYQRGDGQRRWLRFSAAAIRDPSGELLGGVVASVDIDAEKRLTESLEKEVEKVVAERHAAQEALRQSQKLEAMGQLTGGVAHDFNNLLTPIIGSLDLLQRKQVLDERTGRLVDGALASAEKARVLVQRLLAFARRQPLQPQAVDLGRIVSEMSDLIASTSGPRVKVEVSVPPHLPPALADGNQLEMALLNLAVNARDAMPDGGRLVIAARREDAGSTNPLPLRHEPHLVLAVSDTGVGMDEETRRRAIEPFFSTKGLGKGTGLGLSMVHGLAAQLGGALDIKSAPGVGTTIELWLPIAHSGLSIKGAEPTEAEAHGAGVALLVDDEELVRASTAGMLADLGYVVEEAESGEEAVRKVEGGLVPALLVTDQLMPGLSGTDLAVRLLERLPSLPVLIVSGYADLDSLSPAFPHLSKPFRQSELAAALEKLAKD